MMNKTLGVLGGLGPMSSVYFYEMLTAHTKAARDQDHLNIMISSKADIPDRTAYILGASSSDPTPYMIGEVTKLINAGADLIAIPCNTAHCFYESISIASSVPVINIVRQTVKFCRYRGLRSVGVLATEGTVASGAYRSVLQMAGIDYITCDAEEQAVINHIIYGQIKKGLTPDVPEFMAVANSLRARGAEALILGCTELSLIKKNESSLQNDLFIDSLEVLAASAIKLCGKETVGFEKQLESFDPS